MSTELAIKFGPYVFNEHTCVVESERGRIQLTRFESVVLSLLAANPGLVVSKDKISQLLYMKDGGEEDRPKSNSIEVFIKRLRTKLDPSKNIRPIRTIRGHGYLLTYMFTEKI